MNLVDCPLEAAGDTVAVVLPDGQKIVLPKERAEVLRPYIGNTICFGVRPEDLSEAQPGTPNTIHAVVSVYELLGAEVFLYFTINGANMTARVNPKTDARTGSEVKFAIDVDKVHVFDKETEQTITN